MKQRGWGRERAKRTDVMVGTLAGIFEVFLRCGGCGRERQNAQDVSGVVSAYQFAPGFGIIAHSPYPVYVLEDENGYAVSRDGVRVELVREIMQDNELITELRILGYRKNNQRDDRGADSWTYDIRCFGPGIPGTGYTVERMGTHSKGRENGDGGCRETLAEFCTISKIREHQEVLGWQQERAIYHEDIGRLYGRTRNHKRQIKQIPVFLDEEYL